MHEVKCLEHQTLKVPYESINKTFRSVQKVLESEVSQVTRFINESVKSEKSKEFYIELLNELMEKVTTMDDNTNEAVIKEVIWNHFLISFIIKL